MGFRESAQEIVNIFQENTESEFTVRDAHILNAFFLSDLRIEDDEGNLAEIVVNTAIRVGGSGGSTKISENFEDGTARSEVTEGIGPFFIRSIEDPDARGITDASGLAIGLSGKTGNLADLQLGISANMAGEIAIFAGGNFRGGSTNVQIILDIPNGQITIQARQVSTPTSTTGPRGGPRGGLGPATVTDGRTVIDIGGIIGAIFGDQTEVDVGSITTDDGSVIVVTPAGDFATTLQELGVEIENLQPNPASEMLEDFERTDETPRSILDFLDRTQIQQFGLSNGRQAVDDPSTQIITDFFSNTFGGPGAVFPDPGASFLGNRSFVDSESQPGGSSGNDTDFGDQTLAGFMGPSAGIDFGGLFVDFGDDLDGVANFAHGGSFVVGGVGGEDSQIARFRVSPGERVTIEPTPLDDEIAGAGVANGAGGPGRRPATHADMTALEARVGAGLANVAGNVEQRAVRAVYEDMRRNPGRWRR